LTTVPSINALLEPAIVATRTQTLAASTHGFPPPPDRVMASSQSGFMCSGESRNQKAAHSHRKALTKPPSTRRAARLSLTSDWIPAKCLTRPVDASPSPSQRLRNVWQLLECWQMPDLVRRHPRPQPDRTWRARFERALHLSSALCVHLEMRSRTVAASLFQLSKAGHAIRVYKASTSVSACFTYLFWSQSIRYSRGSSEISRDYSIRFFH
jgi:hypothetical protein